MTLIDGVSFGIGLVNLPPLEMDKLHESQTQASEAGEVEDPR